MTVHLLILIAGLAAGLVNSIAGGGSFISFPALIYAGLPPVAANTSNTVALLPAAFVSTCGYRPYRKHFTGISWKLMVFLTLTGGGIGAVILLRSSAILFNGLVPCLLLISSVAFAFGKKWGDYLRKRMTIGQFPVLFIQFCLGIYSGYFGGAVGIMMMALWHIFGIRDIKMINANRTYFVFISNIAAVLLFVVAQKIIWPQTLTMMLGTIIGGYSGTAIAKKLDPTKLRSVIVVFNFIITAVFFYRTYY